MTIDFPASAHDGMTQGVSRFGRRRLLAGTASGAVAAAFASLARPSAASAASTERRDPSADYGLLRPAVDEATGLTLLALPEGFTYHSYGWTGQIMTDGQPTPTDHDGMAVVDKRGGKLALVRNHELTAGESTQSLVEGGMYDMAEFGGTTNLVFDRRSGRFTQDWASLGGCIRNCAGGPTPWRSWLSCEETFEDYDAQALNHGYIFDVPGFGTSNGTPIRAAGRFSHEAVAVDTRTGIVYETEDDNPSALYAYENPGGRRCIVDGGELYAMVVVGSPRFDLSAGFETGTTFDIDWQLVADPEAKEGRAIDSAPDAAIISRGEGAWYDRGTVYFVSTDGGAAGAGQIWALDPREKTVTLLFESPGTDVMDAPDNIAVSRRGGILLCEDGGSDPKRLIGLTPGGAAFDFAENLIDLAPGDVDRIDAVYPGTKANFWDEPVGVYSDQEWCGATFAYDWLFVNVQSPGVTFAITGPWERGAL